MASEIHIPYIVHVPVGSILKQEVSEIKRCAHHRLMDGWIDEKWDGSLEAFNYQARLLLTAQHEYTLRFLLI